MHYKIQLYHLQMQIMLMLTNVITFNGQKVGLNFHVILMDKYDILHFT